ncbi:MASE3 domain-containing protein [Citrifermentans bremense]|uniref:MASE3 domain-containing protein n=1 Tax=Citrifermentans bremense TaxID=60035 RepID=UPI0003FBBE71|nr:MASE3 domain-containing protein [Citrifermentans bremense]
MATKTDLADGDAAIPFIVFTFAVCGLYVSSLSSYLLFHALVEIFCILVLLGSFVVAWNSRRQLDNHYFLFLAISFLSSGTFELLHTLAYKGLSIFPGYDANLPTQFWIASRYVFSLSFLIAPVFIVRRLKVAVTLTAFACITALLVSAVFSGNFPDCFVEGSGLTPFKVYSEYVIIAVLAAATMLLLAKKEAFDTRVLRALIWSLTAAAAADVAFTKYVSVYGSANLLGHLFLLLSAFLVYRAIVVTGIEDPAALLFRSLELSREQFRRSIADAPIPVIMHAEDGEVLQVSGSWTELTGYAVEDIPTLKAWLDRAVSAADCDAVRTAVSELCAGNRQSFRWEMSILTRDGRSRYWNISASSPGTLQDGRRFVVCMAVDITERRESEAALQRGNLRLDLLASNASRLLESDAPQQLVDELCQKVMSYVSCDAYFNFLVDEQAGCLRLNACAGISAECAESLRYLEYGVAVCGCAARDACRIVAENIPEVPDPRTELVKSLGITAYACHPLMSHGRVLGTLSFGTRTRKTFSEDDLSLMKAVADQVSIAMERKTTEENLQQAKQAAEAASRTKSQFLANMSHELRTPMTGVLGMLDLALQSPSDLERSDYIRTAYRSGRSLLQILNDILDLSKVEAGKYSLDLKPFSLKSCVAEAVDIAAPEAKRKGLELELDLAQDLPAHVAGDQVRLRQVLTNLVGNAVKFTERGRVTVQVEVAEKTPEGELLLRFRVSDTGIGIPQDKRHLLFQAFSQIDDSNTRNYGGTGLGLAISKEIVQRMGGEIGFESGEGVGSTFTFTARLVVPHPDEQPAEVAVSESVAPDPGGQELAGLRLLIAEDDATIRQVLATMLQRLQFSVDFAEDGSKVVEMWRQGEYDLILMDVQMPRMDGFQATRAIREQEQGGRIPIIAMTAHAMKEDQRRCLDAGMDDYISKPINFKECIEKVKGFACRR